MRACAESYTKSVNHVFSATSLISNFVISRCTLNHE